MSHALFVVSEEGYWGEECIVPLEAFSEAGVEVTIATPSGSPPVIDERSIDPEEVGEETAAHMETVDAEDDRLADPVAVADVDADDYEVVIFPGGHGTEWDVNQDSHARALLASAVEGETGFALVVCHAVGLLAFTRDRHGAFLVNGRSVTGFPNEWEVDLVDDAGRMDDGRKLPYMVEDEVKAAGAEFDAELDESESVTVDGDLLTARGPESSTAAARAVLSRLEE